jgi:cobalt-zinc-cadmium efflux system protein
MNGAAMNEPSHMTRAAERAGLPHVHDAHGGHHHAIAVDADRRYLRGALGLLSAFLVVEVVVGFEAGSVALLADAGHMLSDLGAIGASLWAINLAARPARDAWTYGWKRAEILSAAGNGVTLLVVSALIAYEAVRRLLDPPPVAGLAVLVVALIGVAVNIAATVVLGKANRSSLNVEGAFQHILTDLYGFLATVVAGIVIVATGYRRADAIASLVVVALMLRAAYGLLRDSGKVLLEAAPEGVDLEDLRAHLLETDHVTDVHDLHAWTVTSDLPAVSAHIVVTDACFHSGHCAQILDQLQACLTGHFDVEHSTFQLEPPGHFDHEIVQHA